MRIGKKLAEVQLEYYEDPVNGQTAKAEVRQANGPEDEHEHVRDPIRAYSRGA